MKNNENASKFEIFDIFSGPVVAFLGDYGLNGVLVYRPSEGWEFYNTGSTTWDAFHQTVYRNFRADSLTKLDLEERGIPYPPVEQYKNQPIINWQDNFTSEISIGKISPRCLKLIRQWPLNKGIFYIVLEEDEYETSFGDGKFLDLKAAFWDKASAKKYMENKQRQGVLYRKKSEFWYKHSLKSVQAVFDSVNKKLFAELNIASYEHYSLDEILNHLEKRFDWEDSFKSAVPLKLVPKRILQELNNASQNRQTIYLIVYEDYDKSFTGDQYHHLEAAFWQEKSARKYLESKEDESWGDPPNYKTPDRFRYLHNILLKLDKEGQMVTGELVIDENKCFSLENIMHLLEKELSKGK